MSTGISWPVIGGNPYEIPSSGEVSWSDLSDFLIALASAQNTTAQKVAARVATTTPINVGSASDYLVVVNLAVAGASSVILPAGVSGQVFVVADGKGDAATNNITVTTTGGATIAGAASFVVNVNGAAVGFCFSGSGNWTIVSLAAGEGGGSGIARSSIAAGTPNYVVFNAAGTGRLAEEQYLAASRGGLGTNVSAFSGYVKAMAGVFTAGGIDAADLPSGIDPTKLSPGTVSATEFAYLDDVTAPIQAALDSKAIGVASAIDSELALFSGTGGKSLKRATDTGVAHLTSGVLSASVVMVDEGGTGQISANDGLNALLPTQTAQTGKALVTDGTNTAWTSVLSAASPTFTGTIGVPDGTVSIPALAFTSDADGTGTGIYRVGANSLGFAANGVNIGQYSLGGAWTLGSSSNASTISHLVEGGTAAVTLQVQTTNTGTSVAGIKLKNSSGATADIFEIIHGGGATKFRNGAAVVIGNVGVSTGAWTLGSAATSNGAVTHTFKNGTGASTDGTNTFQIITGNTGANAAVLKLQNSAGSVPDVFQISVGAGVTNFRNGTPTTLATVDNSTGAWSFGPSGSLTHTFNAGNITINRSTALTTVGITLQNGGGNRRLLYWDDNVSRFYVTDGDGSDGVYLAENGVAWIANSDVRLKKNVTVIPNALEKLTAIRGVSYDWIHNDKHGVGVIAQEVQAVFPEAVDATTPEKLGVSYTDLIPLLIEAVKEQQATIASLSARLEALEGA